MLLSIGSQPFLKRLNQNLISATTIASSPKACWTFLIKSDCVSACFWRNSMHYLCSFFLHCDARQKHDDGTICTCKFATVESDRPGRGGWKYFSTRTTIHLPIAPTWPKWSSCKKKIRSDTFWSALVLFAANNLRGARECFCWPGVLGHPKVTLTRTVTDSW